jgi:hypothetical protein
MNDMGYRMERVHDNHRETRLGFAGVVEMWIVIGYHDE